MVFGLLFLRSYHNNAYALPVCTTYLAHTWMNASNRISCYGGRDCFGETPGLDRGKSCSPTSSLLCLPTSPTPHQHNTTPLQRRSSTHAASPRRSQLVSIVASPAGPFLTLIPCLRCRTHGPSCLVHEFPGRQAAKYVETPYRMYTGCWR